MDKFGEPARPQRGSRSAAARGQHGDAPLWGPEPWISSLTLLAMLGALAWRLVDGDPENRVVATVLVVASALVTLTLVRIRVRLRVIDGGIAVTGPLRTRRIPWSRVRSISTPQRGRFGRRGALLELEIAPPGPVTGRDGANDAGTTDDELLTFGRFDLGADPTRVGRVLLRHRTSI